MDVFFFIITILLMAMYFHHEKKEFNERPGKKRSLIIIMSAIILVFLLHVIVNDPTFISTASQKEGSYQMISDFGSRGGVSFFIVLLAVVGGAVAWKESSLSFLYFLIPVVLPAYLTNNRGGLFFVSIMIIFFASTGFIELFKWRWNFAVLKKFVLWLLLLGILFSMTTFLVRFAQTGPNSEEKETLLWISDHTNNDEVVLTTKQNEYFVRYFARRKVVSKEDILSTTYIHELFPLLDKNNVSIIYITKDMKDSLPAEQGLRFLLTNERFKLAYSSKDTEVWLFR